MLPKNRAQIHAGEVLQRQFVELLELTHVAPANSLGVRLQRIQETVRGKRGVIPQSGWLLVQPLTPLDSLGSVCTQSASSLSVARTRRLCVTKGRLRKCTAA